VCVHWYYADNSASGEPNYKDPIITCESIKTLRKVVLGDYKAAKKGGESVAQLAALITVLDDQYDFAQAGEAGTAESLQFLCTCILDFLAVCDEMRPVCVRDSKCCVRD